MRGWKEGGAVYVELAGTDRRGGVGALAVSATLKYGEDDHRQQDTREDEVLKMRDSVLILIVLVKLVRLLIQVGG